MFLSHFYLLKCINLYPTYDLISWADYLKVLSSADNYVSNFSWQQLDVSGRVSPGACCSSCGGWSSCSSLGGCLSGVSKEISPWPETNIHHYNHSKITVYFFVNNNYNLIWLILKIWWFLSRTPIQG